MGHLKIPFTLICLLFLFSEVNSQKKIDHWESVVLPGDSAKYFPGNSAPDTDWKELTYDDQSWADGKCSVGYGDDDDSTLIDPVLSVYLRTEFNIADTS